MLPVTVFARFDLRVALHAEQPCELYVDTMPATPKTGLRILWVIEPDMFTGLKAQLLADPSRFDLILAWDSEILAACPNAKLYPFGTSWIVDYDLSAPKQFGITSVVGGKNIFPNHAIRHQLPLLLDRITALPVELFNSKVQPYAGMQQFRQMHSPDTKNELFFTQFHIAIENITADNWFTEKLIDCFQTKTVPIFIGCANIGQFFDTRGMFCVDDVEQLVQVCNNLTPDTYAAMRAHVERNYDLSMPYARFRETLYQEVSQFARLRPSA